MHYRYIDKLPSGLQKKLSTCDAALLGVYVAAYTIWGEARGESSEGRAAVAWVIRNRLEDKRWPNNAVDVCLQPRQFSCWNPSDKNVAKLATVGWEDKRLKEAFAIAAITLLTDLTADASSGANHYLHYRWAQERPPRWYRESKVTDKIGRHIFLQL